MSNDINEAAKGLVVSMTSMTLLEAVKKAEEQKDSNPNAKIVYEWMLPYMLQLGKVLEVVEGIAERSES